MSRAALVVDDSPSMRELVSYTLEQAGFQVTQAGDGQEALDRAGGQRLDLVVTDLNMPVMDGIELIKALRGRDEHRFTPILMLTTETQDARKQAGRAAGATGWLVKPFDPDKLLQVVRKVLP